MGKDVEVVMEISVEFGLVISDDAKSIGMEVEE